MKQWHLLQILLRKNALGSLSFEGSKICDAKQAFDLKKNQKKKNHPVQFKYKGRFIFLKVEEVKHFYLIPAVRIVFIMEVFPSRKDTLYIKLDCHCSTEMQFFK